MLFSKTNEAGIITVPTASTFHHLSCPEQIENNTAPFLHVSELGYTNASSKNFNFMLPPVSPVSTELLRQLRQVQVAEEALQSSDILIGLIVAADALYKRTNGKRYHKQIILVTDAQNKLHFQFQNEIYKNMLHRVIIGLQKLDCTMNIICLNEEKGFLGSNGKNQIITENIHCLQSMVSVIGGTVFLVHNKSQLDTIAVRNIIQKIQDTHCFKWNQRKIQFIIAPGLELEARFQLLLSKSNIYPKKSEYILEEIQPHHSHKSFLSPTSKLSEDKNLITSEIERIVSHWDTDNPDKEVSILNRTTAYRFGSDLIPMDLWDLEGLKCRSSVSLTILFYIHQDNIPKSLFLGSPYLISGDRKMKDERTCAAIAALTQSMDRLKRAAICRFVKSKNADPIIVALLPLKHFLKCKKSSSLSFSPQSLFIVQLPFSNDYSNLAMPPLDSNFPTNNSTPDLQETNREKIVCLNLIDTMMLPAHFQSSNISNATISCLNQHLLERAINPSHEITRSFNSNDFRRNCAVHESSNSDTTQNNVGAIDGKSYSNETWENQYTKKMLEIPKVQSSCTLFRSTFPLDCTTSAEDDASKINQKYNMIARKRYWSDI